mmetsp:Transcript_43505/g.102521  ORF Transcript_43505/g.102521 Transcript_43505/m.102521 type:complete len:110 (-) Transcript_43505:1332-1661(-)
MGMQKGAVLQDFSPHLRCCPQSCDCLLAGLDCSQVLAEGLNSACLSAAVQERKSLWRALVSTARGSCGLVAVVAVRKGLLDLALQPHWHRARLALLGWGSPAVWEGPKL